MTHLHVLFRIAGSEYALPATDVVQMESYDGATAVPGAPPYVAGLVQIRGAVVPVIDLRARFGLPAAERTLDSRIVVARRDARTVGLLVDSAREVADIPPDEVKPPPDVVASGAQGFVRAVGRAGSRLVLLIDFDRVVGEGAAHGR